MVNVNEPTCKFSMEKFKRFCKRYEINFPRSLIDYLVKNNDADLDPNIIQCADNDYYIRYFYGTANGDCSDIATVYEWYVDRLPKKCIPIADPDFGNQICMSVDPNNYGKIYFWNHETMDTEYGETCKLCFEDMILLANSIEDLFEKIQDFK